MINQYVLFNITADVGSLTDIDNTKLANEILAYQKRRSDDSASVLFEDTILLTPYRSEAKKVIDSMAEIGNRLYNLTIQANNYWSQIHQPLESTDLHHHGSDTSGIVMSWVYYVKTPINSGDLVFILDDKDSRCSPAKFTPSEGNYIIFPSYIRHKVTKNLSNDVRICIAGDFSIKNKYK
jgi:hypothetical protein